jgi:hypothetical protein
MERISKTESGALPSVRGRVACQHVEGENAPGQRSAMQRPLLPFQSSSAWAWNLLLNISTRT